MLVFSGLRVSREVQKLRLLGLLGLLGFRILVFSGVEGLGFKV